MTLATDTSLSDMGTIIDRFVARVQMGDTVILYYSGHGFQIDGENYFVPVDFAPTNSVTARYAGYPVSKALDGLVARRTKLNIVILDACRNNPFSPARGGTSGLAAMSSSAGTIIAFATSPGATASDNPAENHGCLQKRSSRI